MTSNAVLISGPAVEAAQILIWSHPCLFLPPMFTAIRTSVFFCGSSEQPFIYSFLYLLFLLFFSPCSQSLTYINLLYLPLFNFASLFFLFFLSFLLHIFVSFIFIVLFPNWHLALVLFSSFCFN